MPKMIEVDDDIYALLCANIETFGESESTVLRRLLNLPRGGRDKPGVGRKPELEPFWESADFGACSTTTERYLCLLGFLYSQYEKDFDRVLKIAGRERRYFGRSESEIEESGMSTHPRQIPGTKLWAMTNSDTAQKKQIMGRVLEVLQVPRHNADGILKAIR